MKHIKFTFIITLLIFLCSSLLFSQTNDTPLSFDEDIPFSLVSGYLFRGNEFFYEKTYNSVKKLRDCLFYLQIGGFINSNSKLLAFPENGLDLTPTAFNGFLEIKGILGTDISFPIFYQFYAYFRNYIYFQYSDDKENDHSENDVRFIGEYTSGIVSGALGFENNWFTPIIVWNRLEAEHENKEDELDEIPEEYRGIYTDRFNEVESRFDSLGFEEKEDNNISFIGYSRKLDVGCIIAPEYTKIDLNFVSGINSNNSILPFSQHKIKVSNIIDFIFRTNIKHRIDYSIKTNYQKTNFKHLKNTVSELTINTRDIFKPIKKAIESRSKEEGMGNVSGDINLFAKFQFDHSMNELASIEVGLIFYAFQVVYEHNNTKLFMPDVDRLYSNSLSFKFGGGYGKGGWIFGL